MDDNREFHFLDTTVTFDQFIDSLATKVALRIHQVEKGQFEISQAQAEKLLTKGKSDIIKGFTSKAGKKFDARLKLNSSTFSVEFEFENYKKK